MITKAVITGLIKKKIYIQIPLKQGGWNWYTVENIRQTTPEEMKEASKEYYKKRKRKREYRLVLGVEK